MDQENIQGTWRAERVEIGGKVSNDESLRGLTLTFDGDKVITQIGEVRHEGTFTLDSFRMPHYIDVKPAPGNTTDKAMQGVYAFESDNNLRICFSQKSRPSNFFTSPNSDAVIFELKRTPPREPVIKMTAADLLEKCRKNKSVAADTYRNTVVQVTGKVTENKDGHVFVGGGGSDYIDCAFNRNYKSELERVTRIKDQQKVTLRGTFNGTFESRNRGAYVQLLNCEVVDVAADGEMP